MRLAVVTGAAGLEGHIAAACCQRLLDRHKGRDEIEHPQIERQALAADDVLRLHDHRLLHLKRMFDLGHALDPRRFGEELVDRGADARGVDPEIGDGVARQHRLDKSRLLLEIEAAQLVPLQHAEFAAERCRRKGDHERGIVAILAFLRIIAGPHCARADRPRRIGIEIGPFDKAVAAAADQVVELEGAQAVIDKFTAEQVDELIGRIVIFQLGEAHLVEAAGDRIVDGDDLPPGDFPTPIFDVVLKRITVRGSIVGTRRDLAEALAFAAEGKVRTTVIVEPLTAVNDVLDRLRAGKVEGRIVLKP
jgi:hypothetical protein